MDTCFVLSELESASSEAKLKKVRGYFQQFSLTECPYSSGDQIAKYKKTLANAEQNWREFLEAGFSESMAKLARKPYEWLRFAGEIEILKEHHLIELFLYPVSGNKAAVSVTFDSSVYDAMYSFKSYLEEEIDLKVKQDFVALLLLIATGFSASAFALKRLEDVEDLVSHVKVADIHDWLVAPTIESMRRWQFQFVGIRADMVDRRQVEKKWSATSLRETNSGYLIYDRIAIPSNI